MAEKFRSIKAFKKFEEESRSRQRTLEAEESAGGPQGPNPLRVLARVKERPAGLRRRELAEDLGVPVSVLDGPLLRLVKEGLVTLKVGTTPDEDVIAG